MVPSIKAPLYRIVSSLNPNFVIENGIEANLNKAILFEKRNTEHQMFKFLRKGGAFLIEAANDKNILKLSPFGDGLDKEQLVFGTEAETLAELWTLHTNKFGGLSIISEKSGKYVTIRDGCMKLEEPIVVMRSEIESSSWILESVI